MHLSFATFLTALFFVSAAHVCRADPLCSLTPPSVAVLDDAEDWEIVETVSPNLQGRIDAAKRIANRAAKGTEPAKTAALFDDLGAKYATDVQLRHALADCVAICDSPDTQKMLAKTMSSGQTYEKLFRLRAARGCAPGIVDDAALKMLADKEDDVRVAALAVLVRHKHAPTTKQLDAILAARKDAALLGPAVDAMTELVGDGEGWPAWETKLFAHARETNDDLRRAALAVLARSRDAQRLEVFLAMLQHDDWATRAIALSWLVRSNSKEAVAAIIERYQSEKPGGRLAADCADTLRKMTGHPLGDEPKAWATWWGNVQSTFVFPRQTGPRTGEKRPPPPSGTVAPQFYGIEVRSQRVVFVIDVSGSMKEPMKGSESEGAQRIDAARAELTKIIEALQPGSLFNVISFSDAVVSWLDGIDAAADVATGGKGGGARKGPTTGPKKDPPPPPDEKARARLAEKQKEADDLLRKKAVEYVGRLNADGGTNIHDALELAFEDPSVDTIFFLSDGIPSTGKETEPAAIRAAVKRWNESRQLKINCVALGQELPLLKWIANDSGGEYTYVP